MERLFWGMAGMLGDANASCPIQSRSGALALGSVIQDSRGPSSGPGPITDSWGLFPSGYLSVHTCVISWGLGVSSAGTQSPQHSRFGVSLDLSLLLPYLHHPLLQG